MTTRIRRAAAPLLATAVVLGAAFGAPAPARADIFVIESNEPSIKVGARLGDKDKLTLGSGTRIRAVLPSGKTQTIKGPYDGAVADVTKGQPVNEGVLSWLRSLMQTGGATETTTGATRSVRRDVKPTDFSWSAISVAADGDVCIDANAKLQLIRATSGRAERLIVVDIANASQAETQWETGKNLAPWPEGLAARPDATYYLMVPDRPRRQVTLRVIDQLPADDDVLAVLYTRGCRAQFESYLRGRTVNGKS